MRPRAAPPVARVERDLALDGQQARLNVESAIGSARRALRRSSRRRKYPPGPARRRDRPWHGRGSRARARRRGSPSQSTMSAAATECPGAGDADRSRPHRRSRRPAVSTSRNGTPPIAAGASTRSRVVPGMAEVIAASRPTQRIEKARLAGIGRAGDDDPDAVLEPLGARPGERRGQLVPDRAAAARRNRAASGATSSSSEKSSAASTCAASASTASCQPRPAGSARRPPAPAPRGAALRSRPRADRRAPPPRRGRCGHSRRRGG